MGADENSRGIRRAYVALVAACCMFAWTLASNTCSEATYALLIPRLFSDFGNTKNKKKKLERFGVEDGRDWKKPCSEVNPAKDRSPREKRPYICGLGARFGCERMSEHSNRRD